MNEASQQAIDRYKERLTTRLQPIIQANFDALLPKFTAEMTKRLQDASVDHHYKTDYLLTGSHNNDCFPDGTKYFCRRGTFCHVVTEQKPQIRTIKLSLGRDDKCFDPKFYRSTYRLSIPYVVSVFAFELNSNGWTFGGMHLAFSNMPIRTVEDIVYESRLPNTCGTSVCVGEFKTCGPIAQQVEELTSHFWQGDFSTDWCEKFVENPFGKPEDWEEASYNDPLVALKTVWSERYWSVRDLLGMSALYSDKVLRVGASFSSQMVRDAFMNAWREISDACKGVDTKALDDALVVDLHSATSASKQEK